MRGQEFRILPNRSLTVNVAKCMHRLARCCMHARVRAELCYRDGDMFASKGKYVRISFASWTSAAKPGVMYRPYPWLALLTMFFISRHPDASASADGAQPRLDHVGPGLTAEECKLANKVLFRVQVELGSDEEADRIAQIAPRILDAQVSSLSCIQEALEEVLEQAYELKELTEEETERNRGNDLRLVPRDEQRDVPLDLKVMALSGLGPLLLHQGNYRLAAEVTIQEIVARMKEVRDRGGKSSDGELYPNFLAQLTAIWYNVQAFVSFPNEKLAAFQMYRGALTGCDKICREVPSFAPAWLCQAEWSLYAAENNVCPGHPSGFDCRSLSIQMHTKAFEADKELRGDWKIWNEMARAASHHQCQQEELCGENKQREYLEAGLEAATATGDEEAIGAMTHQIELLLETTKAGDNRNQGKSKDEL